jgi:hypothetical protein
MSLNTGGSGIQLTLFFVTLVISSLTMPQIINSNVQSVMEQINAEMMSRIAASLHEEE